MIAYQLTLISEAPVQDVASVLDIGELSEVMTSMKYKALITVLL